MRIAKSRAHEKRTTAQLSGKFAQEALLYNATVRFSQLANSYRNLRTVIRIFSSGIKRIAHLQAFLAPEYEAFKDSEAVVGWGRKETAVKAIAYAEEKNLPYIALEDGFLRSVGLGVKGAAPLCLLVDPVGVYYDASRPNRIENDCARFEEWFTPEIEHQAQQAIDRIVSLDLSKYNCSPLCPADWPGPENGSVKGPYVLCIDQTMGDASVRLGNADKESFRRMLTDAVDENPDSAVLIKTHPDVLAGAKKGYLTEALESTDWTGKRKPIVLQEAFAPIGLIKHCKAVYAVTSQTGFEALMAGCETHVYGTPFYAGWGLTVDRGNPVPRRRSGVPLAALFAAAYIRAARYVSPVTGKALTLDQALDFLEDARFAEMQNVPGYVVAGIRRWKQPHLKAFLGAPNRGNRLSLVWEYDKALQEAQTLNLPLVSWAAKTDDAMTEKTKEANVRLIRAEDGFIRSVGLGSDYEMPYSLVFDDQGIYYDPQHPSALEAILNDMSNNLSRYRRAVERANSLIELIVKNGITKYNVGAPHVTLPVVPDNKRVLLVTGQVDGDASVRRGGGSVQSNAQFLATVRSNNPDAYILYLEHPDVASGNRPGRIAADQLEQLADQTLYGIRVLDLLPICNELHVLTSLSGFEALLRGVPVYTYGRPFYAGWGLTKDLLDFPRRKARLSLEELAAAALILYPRYYDWDTGLFCRCEDVCERMIEGRRPTLPLWVRTVRQLRNLKRHFGLLGF